MAGDFCGICHEIIARSQYDIVKDCLLCVGAQRYSRIGNVLASNSFLDYNTVNPGRS